MMTIGKHTDSHSSRMNPLFEAAQVIDLRASGRLGATGSARARRQAVRRWARTPPGLAIARPDCVCFQTVNYPQFMCIILFKYFSERIPP